MVTSEERSAVLSLCVSLPAAARLVCVVAQVRWHRSAPLRALAPRRDRCGARCSLLHLDCGRLLFVTSGSARDGPYPRLNQRGFGMCFFFFLLPESASSPSVTPPLQSKEKLLSAFTTSLFIIIIIIIPSAI